MASSESLYPFCTDFDLGSWAAPDKTESSKCRLSEQEGVEGYLLDRSYTATLEIELGGLKDEGHDEKGQKVSNTHPILNRIIISNSSRA